MSSTLNSMQALGILKMVLESFNKKDLIMLNNIVFLAQYKNLIKLYDDFILFGKMGVSSSKLGWHYNLLLDKWNEIEYNDSKLVSIKEFVKRFSNLDSDEIGLFVYYLNTKTDLDERKFEIIKKKILSS